MDRFDRPGVIEDPRRIGGRRSVGSVREAIECLAGIHWPRPYGAQHRAAERACLRAHAGEILPEAARQAFMEAAREAGILIGEARVGGGQQTEGSPQGLPVLNHERDPPAVSEACAERGDEPFSPEAAQEVPARGSQQTEESTQGLPAHHHERDHPAMSEVPFSPIRDILMVVLLPAVIIMALVAAVVVVFGGL